MAHIIITRARAKKNIHVVDLRTKGEQYVVLAQH